MGLIRRLLFDLDFFFYDLGHSANHFLVKPPKQIKHVLQISSSSQTNTNSLVIIHTLTHCVLQTQNVHRTKTFSVRKVKKNTKISEKLRSRTRQVGETVTARAENVCQTLLDFRNHSVCGAKQGVPKKVSGECMCHNGVLIGNFSARK